MRARVTVPAEPIQLLKVTEMIQFAETLAAWQIGAAQASVVRLGYAQKWAPEGT